MTTILPVSLLDAWWYSPLSVCLISTLLTVATLASRSSTSGCFRRYTPLLVKDAAQWQLWTAITCARIMPKWNKCSMPMIYLVSLTLLSNWPCLITTSYIGKALERRVCWLPIRKLVLTSAALSMSLRNIALMKSWHIMMRRLALWTRGFMWMSTERNM